MAKANDSATLAFKVVGVMIVLLGWAASAGMLASSVSENTKDIKELKSNGCVPSGKLSGNISGIIVKLEGIEKNADRVESQIKELDKKLDRLIEKLVLPES